MTQLLEKTRQELINKSKSADKVKAYGTTRYERRTKQHPYNTVAYFNRVDFNALFRANLLSFIIPIHGETNDYEVEVYFEGICEDIKKEIERNNGKLEYKCVYRALVNAINREEIMVACTCPDFRFTQSFWASKGRYNGGRPELRPAKITNPDDTKGGGCKHIMNVLGNLDWAMKLASSINNYISYMHEHYEDKYNRIIYPAITGKKYDETAEDLFDFDDELANTMDNEDDLEVIDQANAEAKDRNKFKPDEEEEPTEEPEEEEE